MSSIKLEIEPQTSHRHHLHHQPINVHRPSLWVTHKENGLLPTTRANAYWWVLTSANAVGANDLTCLLKYGGARVNKLLFRSAHHTR
jgi:hypothetical protein